MLQGLEPHALFSCKIILITLYLQEIPQSENNFLSFFFSFFLSSFMARHWKIPRKIMCPSYISYFEILGEYKQLN